MVPRHAKRMPARRLERLVKLRDQSGHQKRSSRESPPQVDQQVAAPICAKAES